MTCMQSILYVTAAGVVITGGSDITVDSTVTEQPFRPRMSW
jgi:hypothetical protein